MRNSRALRRRPQPPRVLRPPGVSTDCVPLCGHRAGVTAGMTTRITGTARGPARAVHV